jgi:glycerol kinase
MTSVNYVAAIDQGTTSTRCILFDQGGNVVSLAQEGHRQIYPKPGWVEHDPLEIWQKTKEVVAGAIAKLENPKSQITGIGVANQRETTVVWDRLTGQPVCNAIVWQDTRTDAICAELSREGGQDRFRVRTGLPLATYISGPKIKWILDNFPDARKRAGGGDLLFGTMDTWLIWNLTGAHVTDVTNASRTLLMDLVTLDWDQEILDILGIPRAMLPPIRSSSEVYGEVGAGSIVPEGGIAPLRNRIRIAGDLGDQQAALFGQTCFEPGEAKNTYGTGCFMLLNTGETPVPSTSGLLTTLGYKLGSRPAVYALEGSIAITGALVQWLRDNLGLIENSSDVEGLARSVDDNGGVYFVPAFSGLFAPYWRSEARGIIAGLTRYANKGHLARAALEATAYQTREALDAMEKDSGVKLTALKVDGGMVFNDLLMQFQADMLGVPVIRPKVAETTALGAAYAAGLAVGFWSNAGELRDNWRQDRDWQPQMESATRDRLYAGWKKAVTRTFDWVD